MKLIAKITFLLLLVTSLTSNAAALTIHNSTLNTTSVAANDQGGKGGGGDQGGRGGGGGRDGGGSRDYGGSRNDGPRSQPREYNPPPPRNDPPRNESPRYRDGEKTKEPLVIPRKEKKGGSE